MSAPPAFFLPDEYLAAVRAPVEATEPGHWFVFSGGKLLVDTRGERYQVPIVDHPRQHGLDAARTLYLGTLAGRHCYSAEVQHEADMQDGLAWLGLRQLFGRMDEVQFALAGRAVQIVDWDRSHVYCGRCATPTLSRETERARECPACAQVSYPRLAPAVMALVTRGQELLLARSQHFMPGMYSALAGFVEPGETLEQCLVREVREEVGVEVANLRYFGSQPWPFPHSLMIAFVADHGGGDLRPDPAEIEDCGWFHIDRLPGMPGRISIARRLIDAVVTDLRAAAR